MFCAWGTTLVQKASGEWACPCGESVFFLKKCHCNRVPNTFGNTLISKQRKMLVSTPKCCLRGRCDILRKCVPIGLLNFAWISWPGHYLDELRSVFRGRHWCQSIAFCEIPLCSLRASILKMLTILGQRSLMTYIHQSPP